jgi:hypothetical protein
MLLVAILIIAGLTLLAAVVLPIAVHLRTLKKVKQETSQLISNLDKNLAATVKLLEVRSYYDETSATLKKMLDVAYKDGNRFRQDQIRQLINRLETLKVRALDKQVGILKAGGPSPSRKRRRKPRNRTGEKQAPQDQNTPQK